MSKLLIILGAIALPLLYVNCHGGGFSLDPKDSVTSFSSTSPADQIAQLTAPDIFALAKQYMPADETAMTKARIARLQRPQIDLTIKTILPTYYKEPIADAMPKDPMTREYYETDASLLVLNEVNLDAYQVAIQPLLDRVAANASNVINCASQNNSSTCLQQQARAFVNLALRNTATSAEVDKYVNFFTTTYNTEKNVNIAASALVEVVLNSPAFLFRSELPASGNAIPTPDLLQAMSYALTNAPPSRFSLGSPALASATDKSNLAKNLLSKPEARDKLISFFMAWLEVQDADSMVKDPATFPNFDKAMAQAVIDETTRFLNFQLSQASPTVANIMSSTDYFVSSKTAPLYGVTAAAADGSKSVKVDPTQRRGLFTQAAFLASRADATKTAVIKRGKMILNKALCVQLAPPPMDVTALLAGATGTTQRQKIEGLTSTPGTSCVGCHSYLNPLGFSLENYSATGQWRTTDNGAPVDARVSMNFIDNTPVNLNSAIESVKFFTESHRFKQCFIRELFKFYMGRNEEPSDDPLLRQMFYAIEDGKDIKTLLEYMVTSNRFEQRQ